MAHKIIKKEVPYIAKLIESYQPGYLPRLMICLVDKITDNRIFIKSNGDVYNPTSGTIVDSSLVEN